MANLEQTNKSEHAKEHKTKLRQIAIHKREQCDTREIGTKGEIGTNTNRKKGHLKNIYSTKAQAIEIVNF